MRDGDGLLLGQSARDAHHQFAGERPGVDILFFKVDGHTQGGQLSQGCETVLGVSGEAGDGFAQHPVDLSLAAVGQQALEVLPLVHPGPGQALIRIHIYQLPIRMGADLLRVRLDLGGIGVELVTGVGADAAVRSYPQGLRFCRLGRDIGHIRCHRLNSSQFMILQSVRPSRWYLAAASLSKPSTYSLPSGFWAV